jgi:hypothetical protein
MEENKEEKKPVRIHTVPDIVDPADANICDGCE